MNTKYLPFIKTLLSHSTPLTPTIQVLYGVKGLAVMGPELITEALILVKGAGRCCEPGTCSLKGKGRIPAGSFAPPLLLSHYVTGALTGCI